MPQLPGAAEITIKKSAFLAQVHACQEVDGIRSMVQERRSRHFKARHVAWAAVIGPYGQQIPRYSDDGEPSGTAGRPILSILQKQDRTHTLVTVVRYFGGIKLGTGGLVKAYSEAAKQALEATRWEPLLSKIAFQLVTGYGQWPLVEPALHHHGVEVLDTGFTAEVTATGRIVETEFAALERDLINLCGGHIRIVPSRT
jgi:uncharacterized YigZ family protein